MKYDELNVAGLANGFNELFRQAQELLNFQSKKTSPYHLNSLEKFMLAHENEYVSYNSHIILEFEGFFNKKLLEESVVKLAKELPILRTNVIERPWGFFRHCHHQMNFEIKDVINYTEALDQDGLDVFCNKKFDLKNKPPFRFLIYSSENKHKMIFSIHHSIADGAGQFYLFEEFSRIWNGKEVNSYAKVINPFRFRSLYKVKGVKWFLKNLFKNIRPMSKQRRYTMASLVTNPSLSSRFVTSRTLKISDRLREKIKSNSSTMRTTFTEYLTFVSVNALDQTLNKMGDKKNPIMVYMPKNLRGNVKIRKSFQNILSTVWIVGKRSKLKNIEFLEKIKRSIKGHNLDTAAKFIFGSLWTSSVLPPKKLRTFFKNLDQRTSDTTCSLLVSSGRIPKSFELPEGMNDLTISARGTMLKSPGVGIIYAGTAGNETLTIEYLKDLVTEETINSFEKELLFHLEKMPLLI